MEDAAGQVSYQGIFIDVLESHRKLLDFTYDIVESPGGVNGIKQPDGSFTGATGLLQRGEVDMIMGIGRYACIQ